VHVDAQDNSAESKTACKIVFGSNVQNDDCSVHLERNLKSKFANCGAGKKKLKKKKSSGARVEMIGS
jgi:hypothetical protein